MPKTVQRGENPSYAKAAFSNKKIQRGESPDHAKAGGKVTDAPPIIRPSKEMQYISLHHHSTYSYVDGFGLPEAHVRRAAELGMPSLALTEHGNVSSHAKLAKAAAEYDVHPIFGCELYTGAVGDDRTQRKNHLTILAEDAEGYRNLLRVVSQGWTDYYYEPTVSGQALADRREGLIVLSGCTGSLLSTSLVGGKNVAESDASYARARNVARRFKKTFGDGYYLEVQMFPELEKVRQINQAWERLGKELDIPLVATGDCHYTKPDENEMQIILHSVGRGKSPEELARNWGYDVKLSPPLDDNDVYKKLRGTGLSKRAALEAIASSAEIASRCNVTIPQMDQIRFPFRQFGFKSREDAWHSWLREGWDRRRMDDQMWKRDAEGRTPIGRVKYEMEIMEAKDFTDYFLVVSELVKFAKDSNIPVGPARGSAAASLVCFLLRITEVNPMDFPNMMFERFVDYTREDLPDIDLDFDDERRHEVFEHAAQVYGREYVGKIGTFTTYKAKLALDDVGYALHVPKGAVETVKELLLERSSGDLRASATIEDTVETHAAAAEMFEKFPQLWKSTKLEGNVKGMSTHAAGLVVATRPITDVCAVYTKPDKKGGIKRDEFGMPEQVVSFDKYDAEEHNLLKMDILGLANMALIRIALDMIGMKLQDLYDLPLDDEETMRGFQENDCVGIFQFDGWAMRSVNSSLKPDNFADIMAVNALARPGPLHSNASAEFVEVKRGQREPSLSHPLLDPIVADTYGQIIYQEQILRIVREIGDFSWTHAAYIRKIISRKIGEQEFNRQKDTFAEGARKKGLDDDLIDKIWGACITAGGYAFNVPHCASYGMLGYWTMWLKRHHPQAFYTAAFRKLAGWKTLSLLRDATKHDIEVLPPSLNEAGVTWTPIGTNQIMGGYSQIKGIGDKMAPAIIADREKRGPFKDWADLERVKGIGPAKVTDIRTFAERDDPFEIFALERRIARVVREITHGSLKGKLPKPTHKTTDIPMERGEVLTRDEDGNATYRNTEVVWIGTIHSKNLRDLFEVNFGKTGEPLDISTVRRPDLPEWLIMYGEDETEQMSITIDRFKYPRFKSMAWNIEVDHDLVLVRGIKIGKQARRALYVNEMWVIDPEE